MSSFGWQKAYVLAHIYFRIATSKRECVSNSLACGVHWSFNWWAYGKTGKGASVGLYHWRGDGCSWLPSAWVYSSSPGDWQTKQEASTIRWLFWLQPTCMFPSTSAVTLAPDQPAVAGTSEAMDMQALESHTFLGINSVISSPYVPALLPGVRHLNVL